MNRSLVLRWTLKAFGWLLFTVAAFATGILILVAYAFMIGMTP